VVGVAGFPGGATFTIGRDAAEAAGRKLCTAWFARGTPGWAAIACCRFANGIGGGGGVVFATTCRFLIAAGGAVT